MKGCTNYTDEATRWGRPTGKKITLVRVLLICALGMAVVFAITVFWPKAADEGFTVAAAVEKDVEKDTKENSDTNPNNASDASSSGEQSDMSSLEAAQSGNLTALTIYLTGSVINPGVYELRQGARLNDAVGLAGGLAEGSATNYINLAVLLQDGQHFHIPSQEEIESGEAARIETNGATGSTGILGTAGSGSVGVSQGEQKVNINTADSTQLESLPGIGVATAQRIIAYREKNGNFASIEELKNVSGIGEKKYEELADKVCV
ncbi:MAG: helix-hairpin-helix domain-containing protein [Coriobacteriales bacterium]|jgi:competence protein ComEA|nr:helix-hairpin-helix domain-containing protein [Coriobacteriales bacterium]